MHTKTSRKIITFALALILALGICANTALAAYTASEWAKPELEKAQSYGLIPDVLKDADLTKPITRAEFAAVAVKAYENFAGTSVTPVASNPFTDTSNADVLKAYNINIVNGTSTTTYSPTGILTRQDAATMLTRVEKKAFIPGWTLATDSSYTLNFTQPTRFADDGKISDYAKSSVYFMNAKGVINGTGNNMFSPTVTASRQEALIIAARMVDNLKGKTLDYTQGATPTPTPTPPPTPPSGGANTGLVGKWVGQVYTFTQKEEEIDRWIEFKSDGTYSFYLDAGTQNASGGTNITAGRLTESGKYSISGSSISVSNRVQSFTSYLDKDASYTNKTMNNANWPYKLEIYTNTNNDWYTGLSCLSINMYPDQATAYEDYFQNIKLDKLDGVLRWPSGLPDYLYPTGCSGIVFSSNGPVMDIEKAFKNKQKV